jgi:hypothetical protein
MRSNINKNPMHIICKYLYNHGLRKPLALVTGSNSAVFMPPYGMQHLTPTASGKNIKHNLNKNEN